MTVPRVTGKTVAAALIGAGVVWLGSSVRSQAETSPLLPSSREEVAEQERAPWTLNKFPPQRYMKEFYWQYPADTPAFFRDSILQIVVRTNDLTRENFNGTKTQTWAGGGWLAWRSGLVGDLFGLSAAFYTSQRIYGPTDESGAKMLAPPQNPLGMLGQLYGRVQFGDQEFCGGRQLVDTPLINPQDSRMVPNTFMGTTLVSLPDNDRNYDYAMGYLWNAKQRDSNDFISMSDALTGTNTLNRGAPFAMLKYRPIPGLSTMVMDYYVQDFVNTAFAQAEYDFQLAKDRPNWIIGANVIDQRSVGADLLTGSPFRTYQASGKVQMTYMGWTLFVAGSATGSGSAIFSQYGSKPNYTDMQQVSFDSANEKAFGGSIAYDFTAVGLPGVSAGAWYTRGWGAIDPATNLGIPNRRELDLWIQYRPTEGPLKGFRLKTQYGNVWQPGNVRPTQPEFQFVVDYTVLFRPPLN